MYDELKSYFRQRKVWNALEDMSDGRPCGERKGEKVMNSFNKNITVECEPFERSSHLGKVTWQHVELLSMKAWRIESHCWEQKFNWSQIRLLFFLSVLEPYAVSFWYFEINSIGFSNSRGKTKVTEKWPHKLTKLQYSLKYILTMDTSKFTHGCELWGVLCELQVWFMFCLHQPR